MCPHGEVELGITTHEVNTWEEVSRPEERRFNWLLERRGSRGGEGYMNKEVLQAA